MVRNGVLSRKAQRSRDQISGPPASAIPTSMNTAVEVITATSRTLFPQRAIVDDAERMVTASQICSQPSVQPTECLRIDCTVTIRSRYRRFGESGSGGLCSRQSTSRHSQRRGEHVDGVISLLPDRVPAIVAFHIGSGTTLCRSTSGKGIHFTT